ncbi:MAG: DUF4037 domain-containing protein [Anaerovoracaceae bacterium]
MKGLELSRAYFEEYGRDLIENRMSGYKQYIAAGLVGEGSECLGFDDEISQDHDFGPAFCIWVPRKIYAQAGTALQSAYDSMPAVYRGYTRIMSAQGGGRIGILPLEDFYIKYTGLDHAPKDNMEWFKIPSGFLATATDGEVFMDNLGKFSEIRSALKSFYPQDVLRKKLAAKCTLMAQSGQYNYARCMKRSDSQAAYLSCSDFVKHSMAAIYLLNESYMPYYKWIFKGAENFSILSDAVKKLKDITVCPDTSENRIKKENLIESVAEDVGKELNRRGLTRTTEPFLQAHGEELMRNISDMRLKNLHIMVDFD